MMLASANYNTPIAELTQLADKVMEVAVPTASKISTQPSSTDLEQLQGDIVSLKQDYN